MSTFTHATYDTVTLKQKTDCMQLISTLTGQAGKGKSYYRMFTCPFCGRKSKTSFTAWKEGWKCWKGCSSGDAIAFIMAYKQMTFLQACEYLGGDLMPATFSERLTVKPLPPDEPPSSDWVADASDLVQRAKAKLWSAAGQVGRDYLLKRGFTPETLDRFNFGYIPPYPAPHAYFVHGIWLTEGIVIPSYRQGQLWNARIRTFNPALRYVNFQGGKLLGSLFNGDHLQMFEPVFVLEGDFNAAILSQLGYQAVSTSSASTTITPYWYPKFLSAPLVLVWGDDNPAGQAFNRRHCQLNPVFHPLTADQDANDLYLTNPSGLSELLTRWLAAYRSTSDDLLTYALTLGAVLEAAPAQPPRADLPLADTQLTLFESTTPVRVRSTYSEGL